MLNSSRQRSVSSVYPWFIVSCGILFYCYNYFLRSAPSVLQNELIQSLHITAYQFGILASAYYWAYTPMQIPAGMLYDKFGVRVVIGTAILMGVLGLYIFLNADTLAIAWLGRFIIGAGCAFAYIGTLKLASIWLPANMFATAAGVTTAIGMTSGALTQRFISHSVQTTGDYHVPMHWGLMVGVILSVVVFLCVRNKPANSANSVDMHSALNLSQLLGSLKLIFKNPQMWLIGAIGCLLYLPASVCLDAYGKEFLINVYGITTQDAINIANLTSLGWIISGPIVGIYSDKVKRRVNSLRLSTVLAAALLILVFYQSHLFGIWGLYAIFFAIGISCGGHALCFPLGKENNPVRISGTSVAVTNAFIMVGGIIFPPIVGKLLDMHTHGIGVNGLPVHTANDYILAMSVIPLGIALSVILTFFVKETHCKVIETPEDELASSPAVLVNEKNLEVA